MEFYNKSIKEIRKMKRSDKAMSGWLKDTVVDPALWIILVASALIASLGDESILRSVRINVGSALVQMGATLLGIVLAGLAIFVVFLDKKYVALLEKIFGIDAEIWPFKWTAIIAIICVTFGLGLIIIGEPQVILFRIIFCGALWSFFYLLWEIYELVKYLATHAKARSKQIQIDNEEKQD